MKLMQKGTLGNNDRSIRVVINSKWWIANKSRIKGTVINGYDYLNEGFKLSLKKDKFAIFEHVDEFPIFINKFGMASRLYWYIFGDSYLPFSHFVK